MEAITELKTLDFFFIFTSVFVILTGLKAIISVSEYFIEKFGIETKWMRKKREEHELLVKTSENLAKLQEKHNQDVEQSILYDKQIKDELSAFMKEMRDSISKTQMELKQFAENRVHDRAQSFKIQKALTDSIKSINDNDKNREKQIDSLTIANKELLASKINDRYKYYISIGGVPEDEIDEFTSLHTAYNACGGNHHGDAKYSYVMEHLPVIPVETKLIYKQEKK